MQLEIKIFRDDKSSSQTFFPKHQVKFFSIEEYCKIIQTKNIFCLNKNIYNNIITNGSIKLIKQIQTQSDVVQYFLSKSNKFLAWNNNIIELWRLADMSYQTLKLENDEKVRYSRLNNSEDELISIYQRHIKFWIKNDNGVWIMTQEIYFQTTFTAEFNESGSFLLISNDHRSFLFNKSTVDGKWKYSNDFQKQSLDILCLIDNEKLAHLERVGLITIWNISKETLNKTQLQALKLDEYDKCYQQCYIRYIQSKELLFAFHQNKCYFFHQNNQKFMINHIIDFSRHPFIEIIYCFNENYLVIQLNASISVRTPLKMLLYKLADEN